MGAFVLAWLFGEGLIAWRSASQDHMPPSPRQLLLASGLFAGLAVLGEYGPARTVAAGFAWAVDLAVLLRVLPGSGDAAAIQSGKGVKGWSSIGMAGNTVIIPDGTDASAQLAALPGVTTGPGGGSGGGGGGGSVSTSVLGATGGGAAANQAIAKQVIAANPQFRGWDTGNEWNSLVALWNRESGWSTTAENPGSGAYGIPQSLHGTKGNEFNASDSEGLSAAQLAAANTGNAAAQIGWGLAYILHRYGSPSAALAHENSQGWY